MMSHEDERIEELEIALDSARDCLATAEQRAAEAKAVVDALGAAMWRIRDAVMHEGGWCYDYETGEGRRIADAVNAIWRAARDAGLPVLGTTAASTERANDAPHETDSTATPEA